MRDIILPTLRDCARSRRDLVFENLALRQQFLVLERRQRSPNLRPRFNLLDRTFWVLLPRWWPGA